jgi:hypothetical protein
MPVISRFSVHLHGGCRGAAIAAGLVAQLASCGSARSFDGTTFEQGKLAFRVGPLAAEWRPIEVRGATLAFRDDAHGGSVLLDARCNKEDSDTPLNALTAHLLSGTTDREYLVEETTPFDARDARHTVVRAKVDGVLMTYDVYVLNKDGCTYDFVYLAPPESFDIGVPPFERFVRGFQTRVPRDR